MKKLLLDRLHREAFEHLAIADRLLDPRRTQDGVPVKSYRPRKQVRENTLLLTTFFDTLDSDFTAYDCTRLVEAGLVQADAQMATNLYNPPPGELATQGDQDARVALTTAHTIASAFRQNIIMRHVQRNPAFYRHGSSTRVSQRDLFREFDYCLEHVNTRDVFDEKPHLFTFQQDLQMTVWNLEDCLYWSMTGDGVGFAQAFAEPNSNVKGNTSKIEEVYCIAQARFHPGELILPRPRSLLEAMEYRERVEMKRFRSVLLQWCDALQHGEPIAEARMRRDLELANQAMRNLGRWQEVKDGSLYFWMNATGGHIPILSNVLTLVATVGGLYEYWVRKQHGWIMLGAPIS